MHGSGLDPAHLWLRYQRYPYLLTKLVTYGLVAVAGWWVLMAIESVLVPVLLAMLIAYLLDPAVDWFEARGFSRTTGIGLFLVVGGAFTAVFLLFLYPTIAHLISRMTTGIPALVVLLETETIPWLEQRMGMQLPDSASGLISEYGATLQAQLPTVANAAAKAAADLWTRTGAIVASVLNLVLIPILTFYFLRDFDRMRFAAVDLLPLHNRDWMLERIGRMDQVVGAWFRGQIEVATILAGMYALGLGITFGVAGVGWTSGVAIGLLAGFLNIVPYFGFAIGFVLATVLAFVDWTGWGTVGAVLATFAVVQALEGYVVTPRVVGEKVGLSPVLVIISLLLGAELMGLLGVLLALPIAGSARVLLPDLLEWYRGGAFYAGMDGVIEIRTSDVPREPPTGNEE